MALNSRGLGRGLDALFASDSRPCAPAQTDDSPYRILSIDILRPDPEQPRRNFDEESLEGLAASIEQYGILQPLIVRRDKDDDGNYIIVAGERRWRAARKAGLKQVPALVRELSYDQAKVASVLENLQRKDLNPIEEARGLEAIRELFRLSVEKLAQKLGLPRSTLSNSLRLLKLDPAIQNDVEENRISVSHAKIIAGLESPEAMLDLRERILAVDLTIRDAIREVNLWNASGHFSWQSGGEKARPKENAVPQMLKLNSDLRARFNERAKISGNPEKGKISIPYESAEQLRELLVKLGLE